MMSATGINNVIFYVPLTPSGNLLLVERLDGRVYIVQNDELLGNRSWTRTQASQAIAAFQELLKPTAPKRFAPIPT